MESQRLIASPLPGPIDRWSTARFSPDGSHLFAVYDNRRAFRWEIDPALWRLRACTIAGGLSAQQWEEILPEQDFRPLCPTG